LLAAVNARFRDVQHALPLLMTVLLYVSPVLYPLEEVPAAVRPLAALNPVTGLVDGFRAALTGTAPTSWNLVWGGLAASVAVFGLGVWVFERTQARLVDVL
ncbi:MAG TPA: ABC transporter permease, partial [Thermoanaerobaculia bacterium]|nr:ABC transporter permease [Thermoanaerobaculia bacterium]